MDGKKLSEHDACVKFLAGQLTTEGWTVYAHLQGYSRPQKIGKHIPDIYARRGVEEYVIEVETWKGLFHPHSAAQVKTFTDWALLSFNRTRTFRQMWTHHILIEMAKSKSGPGNDGFGC
jgi:hypothetical protein